MPFPLQQLEQHLLDDFLVLGEQLFEQGKVQALRELERHLWTAQVEEDYEVEIKITPSRVDLMSCECPNFMTHKSCEHVAAALLALRKRIQQHAAAKEQPRALPPTKQRLSTRALLKNVQAEELEEFVRQYAKRDRNFALALKARFVGTVPASDERAKYEQLLDETIRAARKQDRSISYKGLQTLLRVADELLEQAAAALVQAHFRTVIWIAQSLLARLTPILRKTGQYEVSVRARMEQSFEYIEKVLALQAPPALIEEIWEYTYQECQKVTYRINAVMPHFYALLWKINLQLHKAEDLLQLLIKLEEQPQFSERNYIELLQNKVNVLESLGQQEAVRQLLQKHQHRMELVYYILNRAIEQGHLEQARIQADLILGNTLTKSERGKIEALRLRIAEQQEDDTSIRQYATQRLLATFELRYFQLLCQYKQSGENWLSERKALIQSILQQPYSVQRRDIVASIYELEQDETALLEYLIQTRSLDMLATFTAPLLPTHRSEIYVLYEDLIFHYLNTHFGEVAAKRVYDKMRHLQSIGERQMARTLLQKIKRMYAERTILLQQLSTIY
ncbi:MAG: hypothetical protein AAF738_03115 [Bacteroidota bacterium]